MPNEEKNDDVVKGIRKVRSTIKRAASRISTSRLISVTAAASMGAAGLVNALYESKLTLIEISNLLVVASVAIIFLTSALNYLRPRGPTGEKYQAELEEQVLKRRMVKRAAEIFDQEFSNRAIQGEDKVALLKRLEENMTAETVMAYHRKLMEDTQAVAKGSRIAQHFGRMSDRLGSEVEAQARRGNVNLMLGILMTAIGLAILGWSVYYAPGGKLEDLLAYFAPRLTLGILIQVFSYFFLRLYKQSLSEIKYFQNEITNIESQQLAILLAQSSSDTALPTRIVEALMKTERNFLMNKDQTTIELERERIEQSKVSELLQAVKAYAKPKDES